MGRCEVWHRHRLDDLLACGIAGLSYDQFLEFTERHCRGEELRAALFDGADRPLGAWLEVLR